MKKLISFLLISLILFSSTVFAWNHSIDVGLGWSHDPNDSKHHNSGLLITGDLFPIKHTRYTFWSINGALGQWYSTAPENKNLTTAALTLALRLYPFSMYQETPFYLLGSAGPALLSNRKFGANTQASNLTIQSNVGLGVEHDCIDVNFRFAHYSNAGLGKPNEGFNVLYLLSVGYLF